MEIFEQCHNINDHLLEGDETAARDNLIKLLDFHEKNDLQYSPLVNHLIRQTGLYPYLDTETAHWSDRVVYDAFKTNVGTDAPVTLHREQSLVLKKLLAGENLAISAPTSFGKSFIIDSFIAIKKPRNVVIIVPTIALTDETRRRLHLKFAHIYKIITTSDVELSDRNILIFPQERVFGYVNKLPNIDILIIDEFYKASPSFDKERATALLRAILKLSRRAKQRYFLAPNISSLNDSPFTKGMEFVQLDFNTVCLQRFPLYEKMEDLKGQPLLRKKSAYLLKILEKRPQKTLIYAGTYKEIEHISELLISRLPQATSPLLQSFATWLSRNYSPSWSLTKLVRRGVGVHNGRLHRSLSQIQIRLFEEDSGIRFLVSTSSIIEGVNTCTENVILWRNRNGQARLNDFTYKNIIGRGGRMFKHFVGKIYLLEEPPKPKDTQLNLTLPDSLLVDVETDQFQHELTQEQLAKIFLQKETLSDLLGSENFEKLQRESAFQVSDAELVKSIAQELKYNEQSWNGLAYLNSGNPSQWDNMLYKVIKLQPAGWGIEYGRFVAFVKVLKNNWSLSVPELLRRLRHAQIGLDEFFQQERNVTFKLAALLNDVNTIQKYIWPHKHIDISPFVSKVSHAFLPSAVYQLEEYGLPRMISRKIHQARVIDFEDAELTLHGALGKLTQIGKPRLIEAVDSFDNFDAYILNYFYSGIQNPRSQIESNSA